MKKIFLATATAALALTASAQRNVMHITHSNGTVESHYVDDIAKISFSVEEDEPGNYDAVDLGLSVKWSSRNLGAATATSFGGYYAWGEYETKQLYDLDTYIHYNEEWEVPMRHLGNDISGTPYDAARANLGGEWRMPTYTEWNELITSCEWTWKNVNGTNGYEVMAPNGNSIFLPAAGRIYGETNGYENVDGFYWVSTLAEEEAGEYKAYRASFGPSFNGCYGYDTPVIGMSIRPVLGETAETDPEPEPGPMNMVDLGLSVKWGGHNVGAANESEYGNYYSWGVTKMQVMYSEQTHPWCDPETGAYTDLGDNIGGTKYDVATVRWGEGWRMPTKAEFDELLNECTWQWTNSGGHLGYRVTGPNGNSIFLPASGFKGTEGLVSLGSAGYYASSNPHERMDYQAYYLYIASGKRKTDTTYKCLGITVRPVHE